MTRLEQRRASMAPQPLTLHNLQVGPVPRIHLLPLLDLRPQPLADALCNGGAINLGGRHTDARAAKRPAASARPRLELRLRRRWRRGQRGIQMAG